MRVMEIAVQQVRKQLTRTGLLLRMVAVMMLPGLSMAFAQTGGGTIEGTVRDTTGALLPRATVTVTAVATRVERNVTTNSAGIYSAPDLPAGRYKVVFSADGFGSREVTDLSLSVGSVRTLDMVMSAGRVELITVQSSSGAIDTSGSAIQGVVDGRQTRELPLNGRDWTELAQLQPGVSAVLTQYATSATATTRLNRGLGSQLTIGGNRPQQNAYRLDGVNINDYANGSPGSVSGATLGVDAVQEFSVISSNAPAGYGRMSGGVINSVTRSGSNAFRGSVYEYVRNSVFDARNYFDPATIPSFRRNQFGGSYAGPVVKDRSFFFANYEGFRQSLGSSLTAVVPSANARMGIVVCKVSATCPAGTTKINIHPKVAPFLSLFRVAPSGTGDSANFQFVTQQSTNEDFATFHLDEVLGSKDTLRGTGLYDTGSFGSADASYALIDQAISRRATGAIEETHIFSASFTNAARFGYARSVAIAPRQGQVLNPAAADTALANVPGASPGALVISGLTTFNGGPGSVGQYAFHSNSYQYYDDATLIRGKHSISFGAAVERLQDNEKAGLLPFGSWAFASVSNFLQNIPLYYESGLPSTPVTPRNLRQTIAAGYVSDDWRALPNLTFNLGVRYEMATNLSEKGSKLSQLINISDPAGSPVSSYFASNPTLRNFEPRLGFAYDPFRQGKTVVRAAGGLYDVLPLAYLFGLNAVVTAPFYSEGRNTTVTSGSFPNSGFASGVPKLRQAFLLRNPGRTYVMQYNFNLQQELARNLTLTIGYIGSHGVRQPFSVNDVNIVAPIVKSPLGYVWPKAGTAVAPNTNVGSIAATYFVGSSIYNSLQATVKYDTSQKISAQASYTWSRSSDDSSSSIGGASFASALGNSPTFDQSLNRGPSDYDVRHVLSLNSVATLPSPGARFGLLGAPLRGWTLSNLIVVRTGLPFTPTVGGDPLGTLSSSPFGRPDRVNSGTCTRPHTINYVDTSCFRFPGTYQYAPGLSGPIFGNSRRNSLLGPGLFSWTTGVKKETKLTERFNLQLQAQAFNITNHANFEGPQSTQLQIYNASGTPQGTAGQLTLTATTSRQLQFALKLVF